MSESTAIAVIHRDQILEYLREGKILREIAQIYGCSKQALHRYLKDDPEYHEAQREQAEAMIEEAKIETWSARDPVDIARAREVSKFAFRYAESINPERWSPRRDTDGLGQGLSDLSTVLRDISTRRHAQLQDAQRAPIDVTPTKHDPSHDEGGRGG